MKTVACECCYVMKGWLRLCDCKGGPTRLDPENPFGLAEPWMDESMGRNENFNDRRPPAAHQPAKEQSK